LGAADAALAGISTATPEQTRAYAEAEGIRFSLFCDPSRRAAVAWDLLNRITSVAEPAVFALDAEGVVRLFVPEQEFGWVPSPDLLALVAAGVDAGLQRRWRPGARGAEPGGWVARLIRRFR